MSAEAPVSSRVRNLEVLGVIITGIGKFIFVDWLDLKFYYVIAACVMWMVYITVRIRNHPHLPSYWGFRKEGFKKSLYWILPFASVSILLFITLGITNGVLVFNWHILPIVLLYPCWGTIQQFLIIGLIARNLSDHEKLKIPRAAIVLLSSTVFSIVHYPSLLLMSGTFVLALFYTLLYLKYGNLWVLGLFHGCLGGLFYFFVLGRDPWLEFLKALQ